MAGRQLDRKIQALNLLCFLHFFCLKSIPKLNDSTHRTHESNLKSQRTQRSLSWLDSDSPEISVRFGFDSNMFIGFIVVYKSEFTQGNAQNMHSIKICLHCKLQLRFDLIWIWWQMQVHLASATDPASWQQLAKGACEARRIIFWSLCPCRSKGQGCSSMQQIPNKQAFGFNRDVKAGDGIGISVWMTIGVGKVPIAQQVLCETET